MLTVYKYQLNIDDHIIVDMPAGAELLFVSTQYGVPCLWARVDTTAPMVRRNLRIAGTGHSNAGGIYVGTFMLHGGALVFHVFDLGE